jgi:hypothetical protein
MKTTLAHQNGMTFHDFMVATGLERIADRLTGETYAVCDVTIHGVQGCADFRAAIAQEHFIAELAALGLCLFVAAIAGGLAVAFISLLTRALRPIGSHRVYALFPKRMRRTRQANEDEDVFDSERRAA